MRSNPGGSSGLGGLLVLALTVLAGCAMQAEEEFRCSIPSSNSVEEAFSHARSDLSHSECQFQFDAYVDSLLEIAEQNPGEENKRRFSELFAFAQEQGILSESQARERYQRYFTADFVSLGDRYSNCSTTCTRADEVRSQLKAELEDKDQGLLRAAGDQQTFSQADKEYNQLLTLIEATCRACGNQ